jgi:hypothetical protein
MTMRPAKMRPAKMRHDDKFTNQDECLLLLSMGSTARRCTCGRSFYHFSGSTDTRTSRVRYCWDSIFSPKSREYCTPLESGADSRLHSSYLDTVHVHYGYWRTLNLTSISVCFQNQAALVFHSSFFDTHSKSKVCRTRGTNLPISIIEMFFPMHVRAPCPN